MSITPTNWHQWRHEGVLAVLLIVLLLVAQSAVPGFMNWSSQLYLSRQMWELGILALPMTLIMISGGIDLSIGSMMGLCAVTFGMSFQATASVVVAGLSCLAAGLLAGCLNGLLIDRFRLHPLIVTLAGYAAFRGVAEGISQGASFAGFGTQFGALARGGFWGVPLPGYIFLLLAAASSLLLARTATGRYLYAIGHRERAARFSGILVDRIRFHLYALSGLLAGLATLIYVSRFDTAKADAGKGIELDVITAVVVGGTSISGGRGNMLGTTLGLLLMHQSRLFVSRYWGIEELKPIVIGSLLIVSVLAYRALARQAVDGD